MGYQEMFYWKMGRAGALAASSMRLPARYSAMRWVVSCPMSSRDAVETAQNAAITCRSRRSVLRRHGHVRHHFVLEAHIIPNWSRTSSMAMRSKIWRRRRRRSCPRVRRGRRTRGSARTGGQRLGISLSQPSERPKLGHDLLHMDETVSRE